MNLETHDVEVVQLKEECKAIKHELKKCQDHLELKEKAIFAKYEQYTGQEPPDKYLDKVWNSIVSHLDGSMTALETANAGDFDNVIKCGLLKTKLREKYIPVPANNPYTANNPPINLPDTLQTWMRAKYQRENIGT
ncbi:hypothetical protein GLOIN_2v1778214 [Rhizophagus clarus]|uniref:Uncharacterized protein n=1 Tax=Rhizophagus clarus TaxID=94130 RepID=A0A8H3M3A0_9GLOM|nr:hypothetical protein GLOIN_2v1778214 [Rhizophagus clarus]